MSQMKCQICDRSPAKPICFTSHQGFLFFRRQLSIEGVFCRDHCLEAYRQSLETNLKGMWFSPTSLLFGVVSSAWDSAKLGSLPDEVLDAPWEIHKVLCPACKKVNWRRSGPAECTHCQSTFTVASCVHCRRISVCDCAFEDAAIPQCRGCTRSTPPAAAVRYSPPFIYCFASAEIFTHVANPETDAQGSLKAQYLEDIHYQLEFNQATLEYIGKYFSECIKKQTFKFSQIVVSSGDEDLISRLLMYAAHSVHFSTDVAALTKSRFVKVATLLGVDSFTAKNIADALLKTSEQEDRDWWTVLGIAADSSIECVKAAYLAESRRVHPDFSSKLSEQERRLNAERMKELNLAFEAAKIAFEKKGSQKAPKTNDTASFTSTRDITIRKPVSKDVTYFSPPSTQENCPATPAKDLETKSKSANANAVASNSESANTDISFKLFAGFSLGLILLVAVTVINRLTPAKKPPQPQEEILATIDQNSGPSALAKEPTEQARSNQAWPDQASSPPQTRLGQASKRATAKPPIGEPFADPLPLEMLRLSEKPISARTFVYDYWYENVPGYPVRYLALDFILNGNVHFRDERDNDVVLSLNTITDKDLERIVNYIGQGNGTFFLSLPPSRDWTIEISNVRFRGSLVGILNRIVVLRWEHKREYVFVNLDQLAAEDRAYVLSHCEDYDFP